MKSKDVRNLIITLIVLAIGVKLVTMISNYYINKTNIGGFSDLIAAFSGMGDLMIYVLALIVILLLPYYFSKQSGEKKVI